MSESRNTMNRIREARDTGYPEIADMMQASHRRGSEEQVREFNTLYPDSRLEGKYDLHGAFADGALDMEHLRQLRAPAEPQVDAEGNEVPSEPNEMEFLPEDYWMDERVAPYGSAYMHTRPKQFELTTGSEQYESPVMRPVMAGLARVAETIADISVGGYADALVDVSEQELKTANYQSRQTLGRLNSIFTELQENPLGENVAKIQIDESSLGELMVSEAVEFVGYYGISKGMGAKGMVFKPTSINAGMLKRFQGWLGKNLREAVEPATILADMLYTTDQENRETVPAAIELLEMMGVEGGLVDMLKEFEGSQAAEVVGNGVLGLIAMMGLRFAANVGIRLPYKLTTGGYRQAAAFVSRKLQPMRDEMTTLQTALQASISSPIKFRPEVTEARIRKQGKRGPDVGAQANPRRVLKAPGRPNVVIGQQTADDWIDRVNQNMTPEEVTQARAWYKDIRGIFQGWFGEKEADKYMSAWLIANQRESVEGALRNVLRVKEQMDTGRKGKKGGLNDPALRELFAGLPISKGVGQKLSDFVDSALGKQSRTIMADDPAMGAPAVVDVHSSRDMGYVDSPYLNHLRREGYNVDDVQLDMKDGAPTETQYENAAQQMRDMTENLNTLDFAGGGLTPLEVQAIGWTAQGRVTGASVPGPQGAFTPNINRVSFELAPGSGSPLEAKYGDRYGALPLDEQMKVTGDVLLDATNLVDGLVGTQVSNIVHSTGAWMQYQNASVVNEMLASPETAELAANALGYLAQQQQVWVNTVKNKMTKTPKAFSISISSPAYSDEKAIQKLWDTILAEDESGLIQGYQPVTIEGDPGIMILIDKGGQKLKERIVNEVGPWLNDVNTRLLGDGTIDGRVLYGEAVITKAGNEEKYDGEVYLRRIRELGGEDIIPSLNTYGRKLENQFSESLSEAEARVSKGGAGKSQEVASAGGE